ncbi:MAG: GNAT family N-acetyltransferase [Fimbriimonadaceae bacterium]|nr:GNAT family N-acetyltransferase [Fimbriimonadaceae bacterium]QYK56845.1 MAG: GNAT family N-acetyltransferase [Fimbriimonadaceae bacterium]
MVVGWQGDRVRLVPLDMDRHFENCVAWMNDPEITQWLLVGDFPMTRIAEREWFEEASKGRTDEVVLAIETLAGEHLGTSGIHRIDYRHGTCFTGSLIGKKELWGQGYGSDQVRTRARYIFEVLGLRMIMTAYLEGNEASRRMSEKAGFVECGRWPKKFWKRGAYRDEVLLCLTRDQWLAQQEPGV